MTSKYCFNDAVFTGVDMVTLQLALQFWADAFPGSAVRLMFLDAHKYCCKRFVFQRYELLTKFSYC